MPHIMCFGIADLLWMGMIHVTVNTFPQLVDGIQIILLVSPKPFDGAPHSYRYNYRYTCVERMHSVSFDTV